MTEALLGFAALFALVAMRVPIAFAMAIVGVVGFALLRNWNAAWAMTGTVVFDTATSYTLSVIPLFVFMGNVLARARIAHALYAAADRALGRLPGGLAMASVLSCGGFSAVSGSSLATAATMARVAMPSMRRFGYADGLAAGSIAAGGTLGILIPPSVVLIVYGLLTESDIGQLFIAGIVPGLLGIVFYVLAVAVTVALKPDLAPPSSPRPPLAPRDRIGVLAVVGLFAFVMMGLYGGIFTPTEAAAMGAAAATIIAFAVGGLRPLELHLAVKESVRTTAVILAIVIGAELFASFVNFAGLPDALARLVGDADLHPWLVLGLIIAVYLVLGCVLESLSMILLTVPVFYPVVMALDLGPGLLADPALVLVWFGIIVVVVTEISLITPPVGLNVFVLKNVLPDVSLGTVFWGVVPFWLADLVRLALLLAMPGLSLWLVRLMP